MRHCSLSAFVELLEPLGYQLATWMEGWGTHSCPRPPDGLFEELEVLGTRHRRDTVILTGLAALS